MLEVNGFDMDDLITKYEVSENDVESDSGGTSETGYTVREITREGVREISAELEGDLNQASAALQAVSGNVLSVRFFNPKTKQIELIDMFRTSKHSSAVYLTDSSEGRFGVSFTLQEF